VYTFSAGASLNNNTWNFLALNTSGSTISWSVNAGDAGNSGTGVLSKVVDVANSVGYLGHSFGGDREFAGALCDVRFYANANLSTSEIHALYYYGLQSVPTPSPPLLYNTDASGRSLVFNGPNTTALTASSFAVSINGVMQPAVTAYNAPSGVATLSLKPPPNFFGTATLSVTITATPVNATNSTVLTRAITVIGPVSSTTIVSGTLAYNAPRTLTLAFSDSSGNGAGLVGTSVSDAVDYVRVSQATAPIWATDSSGLRLVGARTVDSSGNVQTTTTTAWPDELGSALVAALPLDTSGVVLDVRALAGGLAGASSVVGTGTIALSTGVSRYYGRSLTFNGVDTSVRLAGGMANKKLRNFAPTT